LTRSATTPRALVISIDGFAAFYWRDAAARLPTLRRLAERGVVAAGMETVFPSTTWPTHVSLVTGVRPAAHGVVGNHVWNRATDRAEDLTGDPLYDAADLIRVPTFYDRAHAAGLRVAAVDWPATRHAASLAFNLPFFKDQAVFEAHTAPAVWRELGALGYPMDRQGEWAQLPKRFLKDAMVADVAAHVVHRHAPDLLLVHFLCVDSLQHLHGPRSPEAYWAMQYVDERIGRLLATLPAPEETNVFVVSDHGFLPVTREIRPNVRLRQLGLLDVDADGRIVRAEARIVMNHGAAYAYVRDGAAQAGTVRAVAAELAKLPGVAAVWTADQYAALGLPTPAEHRQVGDVLIEAAEGSLFVDAAAGETETDRPHHRGTHGQRPVHPDNHAFFAAAGPNVRRGITLPVIRSRDVAPTIAATLGLDMGPTEGRLLTEILA
jgi:predicted AlkP superfamily pyrophosphatase or phosphodiesterase